MQIGGGVGVCVATCVVLRNIGEFHGLFVDPAKS
jgi:hypothetical protein